MQVARALAESGIERIDAEVLLASTVGHDRAWLLGHDTDELTHGQAEQFADFCRRRKNNEPVAYIVGTKEFYNRVFRVAPGVLIPRPATEHLVDAALDMIDGNWNGGVREADSGVAIVGSLRGVMSDVRTVVDIGTGSGCIAIAIALERPTLHMIATDVAENTLAVARTNAHLHDVQIDVRQGDLCTPIADLKEPFLLVSNPPYVADEALLGTDVRAWEPRHALMGGGTDGADVLQRLVATAQAHPFCRGIVVECLATQASLITLAAPRPT